jgi:molybdopterin/thiamine biosynthesis adenylyltransferase
VTVLGSQIERLTDTPMTPKSADVRFDRQARLFGDAGQALLEALHVGVIGAGGGGSIIVEQLAHLGVGRITAVDFDTVGRVNLSRIVGATPRDARRGRKKVAVLADLVERIDPRCRYSAIDGDLTDLAVAERVLDCDFLFLATDTISSRLVFNAIVHRYLIPGIQVGAKVEVSADGSVDQIYVAVRPVWPHQGCLQCNSLIPPDALQRENRTDEEANAQNYLNEPEVTDPSVITLNGLAASHATTVFLLSHTGLADERALRHRLFFPTDGQALEVSPRKERDCRFCGTTEKSSFALGDPAESLPVRRAGSPDLRARRYGTRLSAAARIGEGRLRGLLRRFRP